MTTLLAAKLPIATRSAVLKAVTTTGLSTITTSAAPSAQSPVKPQVHKEAYERETITVLKDEYSKSGGDEAVAEQAVASYGTDTDPSSQLHTAGKGNPVNPLEVSPANSEVSRMTVEKEAHDGSGVEKTATSRRSGPAKGKVTVQYETQQTHRAAPIGSSQVG